MYYLVDQVEKQGFKRASKTCYILFSAVLSGGLLKGTVTLCINCI